jgi:hypothetical protein
MSSNFVLYAVLAVAIFLLFREVTCWYFKFSEMVGLLEKIEENTRKKDFCEQHPTQEKDDVGIN